MAEGQGFEGFEEYGDKATAPGVIAGLKGQAFMYTLTTGRARRLMTLSHFTYLNATVVSQALCRYSGRYRRLPRTCEDQIARHGTSIAIFGGFGEGSDTSSPRIIRLQLFG